MFAAFYKMCHFLIPKNQNKWFLIGRCDSLMTPGIHITDTGIQSRDLCTRVCTRKYVSYPRSGAGWDGNALRSVVT